MKGYSAKAVANYFLKKYRKHGITPLKIQKLVYMAHGWHLAVHDEPLVDDEHPEAWKHGPVFPSLYDEFKHRGYLPILDPATNYRPDNSGEYQQHEPKVDDDVHKFLDRVWEIYGNYSGGILSSLCHKPGSPWETARKADPGKRNAHISEQVIKKYYKEKLEKSGKENG